MIVYHVLCLIILLFFNVMFSDASDKLDLFKRTIIPDMDGKVKGDNGKVCIIGGSMEYTGAPYFAAFAALKAGADQACVITTKDAAPPIKGYSPDLIVYPILSHNPKIWPKIASVIRKMDVVVIGPGLGREVATISLIYEVIRICRALNKPLIIDADGIYAVAKNVSILYGYPTPGVILTPNFREAKMLQDATTGREKLCEHWGISVSILAKGKEDKYCSAATEDEWELTGGGSPRRVAGQGDILAGTLATFYAWAIKSQQSRSILSQQVIRIQEIPDQPETNSTQFIGKGIASYVAAKFTRTCNAEAFRKHGRSMVASNMLDEFHSAYKTLFNGVP